MEQEGVSAYQAKINGMQKYVPFLENVIAKLKEDTQNTNKVAQMELLYQSLTNLKPSKISLDDFKKCQEALEEIYNLSNAANGDEQQTAEAMQVNKSISADTTEPNKSDVSNCSVALNTNTTITTDPQTAKNNKEIELASAKAPSTVTNVDCTENNPKDIQSEDQTSPQDITAEVVTDKQAQASKNSTNNDISKTPQTGSSDICSDDNIIMNKKTESKTAEEPSSCSKESLESMKSKGDSTESEKELLSFAKQQIRKANNSETKAEQITSSPVELNKLQYAPQDQKKEIKDDKFSDTLQDIVDAPTSNLIELPQSYNEAETKIVQSTSSSKHQVKLQSTDSQDEEKEIQNSKTSDALKETISSSTPNLIEPELPPTEYKAKLEDDNDEGVEFINIPDELAENEMILPDSAYEAELFESDKENDTEKESVHEASGPKAGNSPPSETKSTIPTKVEPCFENQIHHVDLIPDIIEQEGISMAMENEGADSESHQESTSYFDPLVCGTDANNKSNEDDESMLQTVKEVPEEVQKVSDDDEDDVQFVETRNSPICILSDDEDENSNTQRENSSDTSLLVPMMKSAKHSDPNTIELLDSSDDDEPTKPRRKKRNCPIRISTRLVKVRPKRTLLPLSNKPNTSNIAQQQSSNFLPQQKTTPASADNHTATPQSNFLNAFNLQPAPPGEHPPAFSAKLCNKEVIIPNAFYGNPKSDGKKAEKPKDFLGNKPEKVPAKNVLSPEQIVQLYRQWLINFMQCFASSQNTASHTCYVLLQQVLKYRAFTRIKDMRTALNTSSSTTTGPRQIDMLLLQELRNVFLDGTQLSETGRAFCALACNGSTTSSLTLTTSVHTGWTTSRTYSLKTAINLGLVDPQSQTEEASTSAAAGRKRNVEDDEYTPGKVLVIDKGNESSGDRRKSLRTQRTRRYDKSFSYNEDDADKEFEWEEDMSPAAVRRKVEQKRLEAQKQRQQQAQSFENAFLEMFKSDRRLDTSIVAQKRNVNATNENRSMSHFGSDQNDDLLELDDEPKQHRIYKVTPTQILAAPKKRSPKICFIPVNDNDSSEVITCDDVDSDSSDLLIPCSKKDSTVHSSVKSKNIDPDLHAMCREANLCMICPHSTSRIVYHYVNDHRGCEVYVSRLPKLTVRRLRRQLDVAQLKRYHDGVQLYEARCVFCDRESRFKLTYWYQHFTMHTGEYAYRCSGCGVRKPLRPMLMNHINQPCPKNGNIITDYQFDVKTNQIEARICTICNYVQLHRHNVLQHLRTQHGISEILPSHIERVVLLKLPQKETQPIYESGYSRATRTPRSVVTEVTPLDDSSESETSRSALQQMFSDYDGSATSQAGQWGDADPGDDLSFMICGMLDVEMSVEGT